MKNIYNYYIVFIKKKKKSVLNCAFKMVNVVNVILMLMLTDQYGQAVSG